MNNQIHKKNIWAFPSFYPYPEKGKPSTGIFAHRQYLALKHLGHQIRIVQPVDGYPCYPFYLMDKEWKTSAALNYPKTRFLDGLEIFHPRIAKMKPTRIFTKSPQDRYVEGVVKFFVKKKIQLDTQNDIFYSQWLLDAGLVQQAAKILGVKSAVLAVGDDALIWPHERPENLEFLKKTWAEADIRIAVADYLGHQINKSIQQSLPYHIVRRGVNFREFLPEVENKSQIKGKMGFDDSIMILIVGTTIKRKGWRELSHACGRLKKEGFQFTLVGIYAGAPDFSLEELIESHNLTSCFKDIGEVAPDKIVPYYQAADIFCLPSYWEGIANAVVEAMSCGCAVVTSDVCGHPELIQHNHTGLLVPKKDKEKLYEALKSLFNPDLRKTFSTAARDFIVNSWGDYQQNAKVLSELLNA